MRSPAEIAADVKCQRVREAMLAELAAGRGTLLAGRISRRTGIPVEEVRAIFPVVQPQIAGRDQDLAAAA